MDVNARISICIPVHNRLKLASLCVPTVRAGMRHGQDSLTIYDDGSDEHVPDEVRLRLLSAADAVDCTKPSIGIDKQRAKHFIDFWTSKRKEGFTHLYLTDSDCIHDPLWREHLLRLQDLFGGAPVCGYRTLTHQNYLNNVYRDEPGEDVIHQRFAPGVSYLLTCEHAGIVMDHIQNLRDWDWMVPALLGHKFKVSRTSYVDHIDMGGMHSPKHGIGPERAMHPTGLLMERREEIVAQL